MKRITIISLLLNIFFITIVFMGAVKTIPDEAGNYSETTGFPYKTFLRNDFTNSDVDSGDYVNRQSTFDAKSYRADDYILTKELRFITLNETEWSEWKEWANSVGQNVPSIVVRETTGEIVRTTGELQDSGNYWNTWTQTEITGNLTEENTRGHYVYAYDNQFYQLKLRVLNE